LTEAHVSKAECFKWFGSPKSKNGYIMGQHTQFEERVTWLWRRVHQGSVRKGKDFGLQFAQGIIYEYNGLGEVDWAAYAIRTVNWNRATVGVKKVSNEFLHLHPTYTINISTGEAVVYSTNTEFNIVPDGWWGQENHPIPPQPRINMPGSKPLINPDTVRHYLYPLR
jgi:hypothetical protein